MPTKTIVENTSATNVQLLNAGMQATNLQGMLGYANSENFAQIGEAVLDNSYMANAMIPTILNRLGLVKIKNLLWTNPLGGLKKGLMEYGQTVEQIHVNLCEEFMYSPDTAEKTKWQREIPDVKTIFHQLNRKGFYKQTIERDNLRQAFLSPTGIDELVTGIITNMNTSNQRDEYNYMKDLMSNYIQQQYTYDVPVTAVTNKQTAEDLLINLRSWARKLGFISNEYNQFGVDNVTNIENLYLFITPEVEAQIDVRAFAVAFNLEFTNFIGHVIVVDDFGAFDDGSTQVLMCGEDFLQVFDTELSMESDYNEQGKYWNYWLHIWQVMSVSRFANCLRFTSGTTHALEQPKVFEVVINSEQYLMINPGGTSKIDASPTTANGASDKLMYSMQGQNSARSTVDSNGFISIGKNETSRTITVRVASVQNPNVSSLVTIHVMI